MWLVEFKQRVNGFGIYILLIACDILLTPCDAPLKAFRRVDVGTNMDTMWRAYHTHLFRNAELLLILLCRTAWDCSRQLLNCGQNFRQNCLCFCEHGFFSKVCRFRQYVQCSFKCRNFSVAGRILALLRTHSHDHFFLS